MYGAPGQVVIEPYPARDLRYSMPATGGIGDPVWLSREVIAQWGDGGWYRSQFDASADPPFGESQFWFEDPLFSDTPGASHAATPEGGVVYMQGPELLPVHYLRVVPGWVELMKRAVDEANQ